MTISPKSAFASWRRTWSLRLFRAGLEGGRSLVFELTYGSGWKGTIGFYLWPRAWRLQVSWFEMN